MILKCGTIICSAVLKKMSFNPTSVYISIKKSDTHRTGEKSSCIRGAKQNVVDMPVLLSLLIEAAVAKHITVLLYY